MRIIDSFIKSPISIIYTVRVVLSLLLVPFSSSIVGAYSDPGENGPFLVASAEYDFGDERCAFLGGDAGLSCAAEHGSILWPVELRAIVYYPSELKNLGLLRKPPLIVFFHGGYRTCYEGGTENKHLAWPCISPQQPIPSYHGFDYVGNVLASNGYIVVSISANGIMNADPYGYHSALARARLIQEHLGVWKKFNDGHGFEQEEDNIKKNIQIFLDTFKNRVDLEKIGLVGHSLGGEAVIEYYHCYYGKIPDVLPRRPTCPHAWEDRSSIPIKAIMAVAPTDMDRKRPVINNAQLAVMLSYCDGDVAGRNLPGVRYFDDARYNEPADRAAKHMFLLLGTNHNFYNSVWTPSSQRVGGLDDWTDRPLGRRPFPPDPNGLDPHCGRDGHRLTAGQQRRIALAYMTGFFRAYLGGEAEFLPLLTGDHLGQPSTLASNQQILISYHAPSELRLDINRFQKESNLDVNDLGGQITFGYKSASTTCKSCDMEENCLMEVTACDLCGELKMCLPDGYWQHRQPNRARKLRVAWTEPGAWYENNLNEKDSEEQYRDISIYRRLQFRAAVDYTDELNPTGVSQDFAIQLIDKDGNIASTRVRKWSNALFYPPGAHISALNGDQKRYPLPKVILNTVNIPMFAFQSSNPEIKLKYIRSVRFVFDERPVWDSNAHVPIRDTGALFITDLALSR